MLSGIAGLIVGAALLPFISTWVGITPQYLWLGMLYCTLLPIMSSATPDGVLRVLDRFEREHPDRHLFWYTRAGYSGTPGAPASETSNFPGCSMSTLLTTPSSIWNTPRRARTPIPGMS